MKTRMIFLADAIVVYWLARLPTEWKVWGTNPTQLNLLAAKAKHL